MRPPVNETLQDDRTLVERAAGRDMDAFEQLVERYRSKVYGLALRMMKDRGEAEEIMQETFLSAWQNLPNFRGDSAFGSWLYRICANYALMRLRRYADDELKKRLEPVAGVAAVKVGGGLEDEVQVLIDQGRLAQLRRRKFEAPPGEEPALPGPRFDSEGTILTLPSYDWSRGTEEKALDRELGRAIEQATEALPDDYRTVFLLKDVEGLSYEEIAEVTRASVPAIKSRLHRARLALREAIEAFYKMPRARVQAAGDGTAL